MAPSSPARRAEPPRRDDALVGRVLSDPAAVRLWLVVTLAGVVVAVVAGHAAWAVIGWAVGGVAAVVLVAVNKRR